MAAELAPSSISGWTWQPVQGCKALQQWGDILEAWNEADSRIWIDLQNPTQQDIEALDSIIDLDDVALEDAVDGPDRPRIDEYENYLALFFYGVLSVDQRGRFALHKIVAFCGERYLVTMHPEAMLSVSSLHERCARHGATMFERGVDVLLYRLIDKLVDNYLVVLDHLESAVDQLESDSFDAGTDDTILRKAASMRGELMEIRRLASAQHLLLAPLARGDFDYVSENLGAEFRHIEEHLAHTLDRVEGLRERLSGALNNYHSTLTKRTNEIVRVLTVFAAVLLPMSLIAGVYGMNVVIWPPGNHPMSFWGILALMASLGCGLLWFFRTRQWF